MRRLFPSVASSVAAAFVSLAALTLPAVAHAGVLGVPVTVSATGTVTGDPPGMFAITGQGLGVGDGDSTHQMRFFIEVTGTTLDIRVFDAGASGSRDDPTIGNTTYALISPTGTTLGSVSIGLETPLVTDNRVARFPPSPAILFTALNVGTGFTGLTPGLYEFRVTATDSTVMANWFGIDIRSGTAAAAPHYNVYIYSLDDDLTPPVAADTSLVLSGDLGANTVFYPFVNRGCAASISDTDGDSTGSASFNSILTSGNAITVSANGAHTETAMTIHTSGTANGVQTLVNNYGMWAVQPDFNDGNFTDWRVADFQLWEDNAANRPRDPNDPIRTYLPNGYTGGGIANHTAPSEPVLTAIYSIVSGANPPAVSVVSRVQVTVPLQNNGPAALTLNGANDQIVSGLPAANATNLGNIQCLNNSGGAIGTPVNGGTFARCNFSGAGVTLAVGETAKLVYQFDLTPPANSTFFVTNIPAAPASGSYNLGALAPTSTTWAHYSPAYNFTGFAGETLGPLCDLRLTVAVPTRAAIRGVNFSGGTLRFATTRQKNTSGFNVYAVTSPADRSLSQRLNREPLRSRQPDSMTPEAYEMSVASRPAYILFEELETDGARRLIGPFATVTSRGAQDFFAAQRTASDADERRLSARPGIERERVRERSATRLVRAPAAAVAAGKQPYRIEVSGAGRVTIPASAFSGNPKIAQWRLTRFGSDVPFQVVGPAGAKSLVFDSPGIATAYAEAMTYVLSNRTVEPRSSVAGTYWEAAPAPGATRVEKPSLLVPGAPQGSTPWIWDFVQSDPGEWPNDFTAPGANAFDLPTLAANPAGPVAVSIRLGGGSAHTHDVTAAINGHTVGSLSFTGKTAAVLHGTINASLLHRTGNTLSLTYAAEGDQSFIGAIYLGSVDLAIPVAAGPSVTPSLIAPLAPAKLPPGRTSYLIVTHPSLLAAANQLAAVKTLDGQRPFVVTTDAIYDGWSDGTAEARAIAAYIKAAAAAPALKFVVLVGDDTFDLHDISGTSPQNVVPSLYAWDEEFGRVPSENAYADVDGDNAPDLAIGRLPADDPDEAAAMVAKIAREASALTGNRHVIAADNQGAGEPDFAAGAALAAGFFPGSAQVVTVRLGDGLEQARTALLSGLRQGGATVSYFGHGGFDLWADEGLLTQNDVASLEGAPGESVVFAWACESQWYQSPFGPSLGESLFGVRQGGAVAAFGPAGITAWQLQPQLSNRVYQNAFKKNVALGEAIRAAKADAVRLNLPGAAQLAAGWNLLGDPSLKLRR